MFCRYLLAFNNQYVGKARRGYDKFKILKIKSANLV